jgi:hypothetical protein
MLNAASVMTIRNLISRAGLRIASLIMLPATHIGETFHMFHLFRYLSKSVVGMVVLRKDF